MIETVLIHCDEIEASDISKLAECDSGSLRNDWKSESLEGFFEFEIE